MKFYEMRELLYPVSPTTKKNGQITTPYYAVLSDLSSFEGLEPFLNAILCLTHPNMECVDCYVEPKHIFASSFLYVTFSSLNAVESSLKHTIQFDTVFTQHTVA